MDSEKRDKDVTTLPYVVFESVQARNERHLRRLWVLILVLIVLLVGSNIEYLHKKHIENANRVKMYQQMYKGI